MRGKLINILSNTYLPIMRGEDAVGVYMLPRGVPEILADALIENGVTFSTFKVGDIVWVYDFMWGPIPCEVDQPYHCRAGKDGGCTFEMSFTEQDIGETVFATKDNLEAYWDINCDRYKGD